MKEPSQTPRAPRVSRERKARLRRKSGGPAAVVDVLTPLLAALGGGPERARLSLLWQNWGTVMGPDLAPLALPLGHHKNTLLLGAEDAMLMQELHLMSGEILERVNAFMESAFFTSVKLSLVLNKNVLRTERPKAVPEAESAPGAASGPGAVSPARPRPSGAFLANMDPTSAVAQCYARFSGKGRQAGHKGEG